MALGLKKDMTRRQTFGRESSGDAAVDALYNSIAEDLEAFACEHHLTIWKYPDRAPMWMFHFLHPAGGFGWLQLYCAREPKAGGRLLVSLYGTWHVDDHEKRLRRHYPHAQTIEVGPVSKDILMSLAKQLEAILRCPLTDLILSEYTYVPRGDGAANELVSDFELSLRMAV